MIFTYTCIHSRASRVEVEAMHEDCEMDGRELEVWWEIQLEVFL